MDNPHRIRNALDFRENMVDMKTVIWYSVQRLLNRSRICFIPAGSRPFVGSSRISSSGLHRIARAMPRRSGGQL